MTRIDQAVEWEKFRDKHYPQDKRGFGERAWAAGFFDGEGHAAAAIPEDLIGKLKPKLAIKQAYGELGKANLVRFQAAVGAGNITGPHKQSNPNQAPYHLWSASSEADVDRVWAAIGPLVGLAKFIQLTSALSVAPMREAKSDTLGTRKPSRTGITKIDLDLPDERSDK